MKIDKHVRADQKQQQPVCVWLTGLPASGKSTVASALDRLLYAAGRHAYLLDGDAIRQSLNRDLGFSESDRIENTRRIAEVARLFVDSGLFVIVAFISPYQAQRDFARSLFETGEFLEVFVDASVEVCERRDPKGLYAKARRGEIVGFTGTDGVYERPLAPEIHLNTENESVEQCAGRILRAIQALQAQHCRIRSG